MPNLILLIISFILSVLVSLLPFSNSDIQRIALSFVLPVLLVARNLFRTNKYSHVSKQIVLTFIPLACWTLVFSSGAVFSPLFVILHFLAFFLGMFYSTQLAVISIVMTLSGLMLVTVVNEATFALFRDDPFTAVLYLLSFIIISPIVYILSENYTLKEKFNIGLSSELKIAKEREGRIVEDLVEMIIVTNSQLQILSMNTVAQQFIGTGINSVLFRPLTEVVTVVFSDGKKLDPENIKSLVEVGSEYIEVKQSATVSTKEKTVKMMVQIKPVFSQNQSVEQLAFIFQPVTVGAENSSIEILEVTEKERRQYDRIMEILLNKLPVPEDPELQKDIFFLREHHLDLIQVLRIRNPQPSQKFHVIDIYTICSKVVNAVKGVALNFKADVEIKLPESQNPEDKVLAPQGLDIPEAQTALHSTPTTIPEEWLYILLKKILIMSLFILDSVDNSHILVDVAREQEKTKILVYLQGDGLANVVSPREASGIFSYTPEFEFASGDEDLLIRSILTEFNLKATYTKDTENQVTILVELPVVLA